MSPLISDSKMPHGPANNHLDQSEYIPLISVRYIGDAFDSGSAQSAMAKDIICGSMYLGSALSKSFEKRGVEIIPTIGPVRRGSWEICMQYACMAYDALCSMGNSPHISAIANISGVASLFTSTLLGAFTLIKNRELKQISSSLRATKKPEHIDPVYSKGAALMSEDLNFQKGIAAIILHQIARGGVDRVECTIGNEYIEFTKEDIAPIQGNILYLRRNSKEKRRQPNSEYAYTEISVLRFEGERSPGIGLYFSDCFGKKLNCRISPKFSMKALKKNPTIGRGLLYESVFRVSDRVQSEFPCDLEILNLVETPNQMKSADLFDLEQYIIKERQSTKYSRDNTVKSLSSSEFIKRTEILYENGIISKEEMNKRILDIKKGL